MGGRRRTSELLGASVLTADKLAITNTFFTRVRVETRSGTFELERGQDGLAPRPSCAGESSDRAVSGS